MITKLRTWLLFLSLSLLLHVTGTIGFAALDPGQRQPATGQKTLSTVDSLQEILGAPKAAEEAEPETVEAKTPDEVEPVKTAAKPVETPRPDKALEAEPAPAVDAVVAANAASDAPLTAIRESEAKPIETLTPTPQQPVKPVEAKQTETPKTVKKVEDVKQTRKEQRQQPKKKKARRPTKQGNSRRNTAGQRRSGGGGTRTASLGAVKSYGVRVRARIAANKPGYVGRGRVRISLGISKSGDLRYARVAGSSGNPAIDRAALRAVRRSSPFPRPPAGASLRQLSFNISFTFR